MKYRKGYCQMVGCLEKAHTRGYCKPHYDWLWKRKMIPRCMEFGRLGIKANSPKEYARKYRKLTGRKSIGAMHRMRFRGNREKVIQRDGEVCLECGMTRDDHRRIYGCDIAVYHIDRTGKKDSTGRGYSYENNEMDNLETLCLGCAGSAGAMKHGKYAKVKAIVRR